MTPAVGQADHTTHDVLSHFGQGDHLAGCRCHLGELTVVDLEIRCVVGMNEQRAPVATFHQHIDVVHPRVVRPQLAAPNEQIPAVGFGIHRCLQIRQVIEDLPWSEVDDAGRGA